MVKGIYGMWDLTEPKCKASLEEDQFQACSVGYRGGVHHPS